MAMERPVQRTSRQRGWYLICFRRIYLCLEKDVLDWKVEEEDMILATMVEPDTPSVRICVMSSWFMDWEVLLSTRCLLSLLIGSSLSSPLVVSS